MAVERRPQSRFSGASLSRHPSIGRTLAPGRRPRPMTWIIRNAFLTLVAFATLAIMLMLAMSDVAVQLETVRNSNRHALAPALPSAHPREIGRAPGRER